MNNRLLKKMPFILVLTFLWTIPIGAETTSPYAPNAWPISPDLETATHQLDLLNQGTALEQIDAQRHGAYFIADASQSGMRPVLPGGMAFAPAPQLLQTPALSQADQLELNNLLQEGTRLRQLGDQGDPSKYADAIALYNGAAKFRQNVQLRIGLISAYAGHRDYATARRLLNVLTAANVDKAQAYFNVGVYYQRDLRYVDAKEMLQTAARFGQADAPAMIPDLNDMINVKTPYAGFRVTELFNLLNFAKRVPSAASIRLPRDAGQRARVQTFLDKIGYHTVPGDTGADIVIDYGLQTTGKTDEVLRVGEGFSQTFRIKNDGKPYQFTQETNHTLVFKTPDGTFRIEGTYNPRTTYDDFAITVVR